MMKLHTAVLVASLLFVGCVTDERHDRYSSRHDDARSSCTAPAVGVCAGCEVSCSSRHDEAICEPGHSMPAQGTVAGFCQEQARCVCRD
jgi:hypothetical protein